MSANQNGFPYTLQGDGDKVMVFLHGFYDSKEVWDPVLRNLTVTGYVKVMLDLPGMGDLNDWDGLFELRMQAGEVTKILKALNKPAILIGQSFGTQVAELVAEEVPELVKGLVLVTPIPLAGLPVPEEVGEALIGIAGNEEVIRQWRGQFTGISDERLEELVKIALKVKPESAKAIFNMWRNGDPAGTSEKGPSVPTLFIVGELDDFASPNTVKSYIAPRFSNSTVEVFNEVGHWAHVERPVEVADFIDQFAKQF